MPKLKVLIAGGANPHIPGHLRSLCAAASQMEPIAVSDTDGERLQSLQNILSGRTGVHYYQDYKAMLKAHPEADAIIIGSDNCDHLEMFEAAVAHRLHIFMMKVISMDEGECRQMIEISRNYEKVIQCELELHFHPQFIKARQLVRSGALGRIESIYMTNISQSPCNYFPNWGTPELSYGKRIPIRPGEDCFRGGAITDHPHAYDIIRWITGAEFHSVRALSARNQRAHLQVEDHAAIMGRLDDGTPYFINPSYSNLEEKVPTRRLLWPKSLECNLKITGSKGYYACDFFERPSYIVAKNHPSPDRLIVEGTPLPPQQGDATLLDSFAACIQKRRTTAESTLASSYAAVRVMNAAYESIYKDQEITLPADALLQEDAALLLQPQG